MILRDGTDYQPADLEVEVYRAAYPGIDLEAEFCKMTAWCLANVSNRKTRRGIGRFINAWLSRAQQQAQAKRELVAKLGNMLPAPPRPTRIDYSTVPVGEIYRPTPQPDNPTRARIRAELERLKHGNQPGV